MANITLFYPAAQKGYALGLNAAGGNLGASVAQFLVPIAITVGAAATLNLPLAGLIWVPLILVAMAGAYFRMDNFWAARADIAASLAALKEPHLWILAVLHIGTFGSSSASRVSSRSCWPKRSPTSRASPSARPR